jgi:hypothetical protein
VGRTVKKIVIFTDDLDGNEYPREEMETIRFSVDGKSYEIDLNARHAQDMRDMLAPYLAKARLASPRKSRDAENSHSEEPRLIRAWANEKGIKVPSRGRIPKAVVQMYQDAH